MWRLIALFALLMLPVSASAQAPSCAGDWLVAPVTAGGRVEWRISYGSGTDYPQYGVLHQDGYFRLVAGRTSVWGTSIIVLPSYWSGGRYYQGGRVAKVSHRTVDCELRLAFEGSVGALNAAVAIALQPPAGERVQAQVSASVLNPDAVKLDTRAGEAFKPLMLSSMHISDTEWDARLAFVESPDNTYPIPSSSWLIAPRPRIVSQRFGLIGGTSAWKTNAPTLCIALEKPLPIAGWITFTRNPNDDNVGFWPATETTLDSWKYGIIATLQPDADCAAPTADGF